jgi:hypothetical protein
MGHTIKIGFPERLAEVGLDVAQIEELVSMYFRGPARSFYILLGPCPKVTTESKTANWITAGLHRYDNLSKLHLINLDSEGMKKMIALGVGCGGTLKPLDLKHGFCLALIHELQHANQASQREQGMDISREGGYNARGSERDARAASDNAYHEVATYLGYAVEKSTVERVTDEEEFREICSIADIFSGTGRVSVRDLSEELRNSKINRPKNLQVLRGLLTELGVEVTR